MKCLKLILLNLFCIILFNLTYCDQYPEKFEGICKEFKNYPLDLIGAFIPKNPVIFEAGAHYGHDTIKFIEKWPHSTVIAFEPNPHAFDELIKNTYSYPNIKQYPLAVSDFNGKAKFYLCYGTNGTDPIFEGASSLLPASDWMAIHYMGPVIDVECVILDDWCKKNDVDHIDFMWLDLEGMEFQVIENSLEILSTVKVIYVETNFKEFRKGMTQYQQLKDFLESCDFIMLADWYRENLQGNAIFIKK